MHLQQFRGLGVWDLGFSGAYVRAVPKNVPIYKTKAMISRYFGEETGRIWGTKVKYLSETERQAYAITIKNSKLYDSTGKLFDTSRASSHFSGQGHAIFVMDEYGNIYISTRQIVGEFHHSTRRFFYIHCKIILLTVLIN